MAHHSMLNLTRFAPPTHLEPGHSTPVVDKARGWMETISRALVSDSEATRRALIRYWAGISKWCTFFMDRYSASFGQVPDDTLATYYFAIAIYISRTCHLAAPDLSIVTDSLSLAIAGIWLRMLADGDEEGIRLIGARLPYTNAPFIQRISQGVLENYRQSSSPACIATSILRLLGTWDHLSRNDPTNDFGELVTFTVHLTPLLTSNAETARIFAEKGSIQTLVRILRNLDLTVVLQTDHSRFLTDSVIRIFRCLADIVWMVGYRIHVADVVRLVKIVCTYLGRIVSSAHLHWPVNIPSFIHRVLMAVSSLMVFPSFSGPVSSVLARQDLRIPFPGSDAKGSSIATTLRDLAISRKAFFEELKTRPGSSALCCSNSKCNNSEATIKDLKRCGNCRSVFYCSRLCQREHWRPSHKVACEDLRREMSRDGMTSRLVYKQLMDQTSHSEIIRTALKENIPLVLDLHRTTGESALVLILDFMLPPYPLVKVMSREEYISSGRARHMTEKDLAAMHISHPEIPGLNLCVHQPPGSVFKLHLDGFEVKGECQRDVRV